MSIDAHAYTFGHMGVALARVLKKATLVSASVAVVAVLTVNFGSPQVNAAPDDAGQVADAPTLSLTSLGVDGDVSLYGLQGTQTITVPVPKGLTPGALTADVELPPYVQGGTLIVTQGDRTLSRIELLMAESTPLSIPLTGARVVDNAVTFTVRSRLLPEEGDCLFDPTVPLQLNDATIDYTGKEAAPTVVADFLPPVLQKMTIFTPPKPSAAESDAAVQVTTAVVSRYGKQNTEIDIASLGEGEVAPPSAPLERNVVIREGPDAAVSLKGGDGGVPALQITGPADKLTNQVRLLSSELSLLALSSKVVTGTIDSDSTSTSPVNQSHPPRSRSARTERHGVQTAGGRRHRPNPTRTAGARRAGAAEGFLYATAVHRRWPGRGVGRRRDDRPVGGGRQRRRSTGRSASRSPNFSATQTFPSLSISQATPDSVASSSR